MELSFYSKYPFTRGAKELMGSPRINDEFQLMSIAKKRVTDAIGKGKISTLSVELDDSELLLQIASYAVSRMIVSLLKSRYYISRYAIAEAKRASSYMAADSDENVISISKELGVECDVDSYYNVRFQDYLKYAPKAVDYKLVNRRLSAGRVRLKRDEFVRMLEEAVKIKVEGELPLKVEGIPANIEEAADEVRKNIPKEPQPVAVSLEREEFAPCMRKLLEDLKTVENLGHSARWALAVYLLNIGMKVDEVVRLFSTSPDFDESVTKYQVEHALKRGYKTPSCSSMDSYGLCVSNCGVKSPLAYRRGAIGRSSAKHE